MFKRRTTRGSFRSRRFSGRRGSTHIVTRPRKWEMATMFARTEFNPPNLGQTSQQIYIHLASIADSLANFTSPSDEQRFGTVLSSMQRAIEVGGVVYDWGYQIMSAFDGDILIAGAPPASKMYCAHHLITDRYAVSSGIVVPASLGSWNPFDVMWPMQILGTSSPVQQRNQVELPTRIHFQKTFDVSFGGRPVSNDEGNILYIPDSQALRQNFGTVNRKLRLRLSDEQGLFAHWSLQTDPAWEFGTVTPTIVFWLRGQLYYRYRQ